MSLLHALRYRLRVFLHPRTYSRELADELDHHLELERIGQQRVAGENPADERARAHRAVGNITYINEERRMISGIAMVDAVVHDVRLAFRMLRRRRMFAVVTIATLALGTGATTALFSVADAVLFKALPFHDADRLITVWRTQPELKSNPVRADRWDRIGISLPAFREWATTQQSFDDVGAWATRSTLLGGADGPEAVTIMQASASLLPVLNVTPELGRAFGNEDDVPGAAPVALVSHEAWRTRFGGDVHVTDQRIRIDSVTYAIIGVLPEGLRLDRRRPPADFWIPAGQDPEATERGTQNYSAIGRLKRDVPLDAARAETERVLNASSAPSRAVMGARLTSLRQDETRSVRAPLLILLAASGFLLIIACANVSVMLLSESGGRERELKTRAALGATSSRLVRQLLTESMVLALLGGLCGIIVAYVCTKLMLQFAPPLMPGVMDIRVDARVLAMALSIACATGLLFGVAPALVASRQHARAGLQGTGQAARGRERSHVVLIACEVALSTVLLVGAALLVQSFEREASVELGFQSDRLLVVRMRLPQPQYSDSTRVRALYADIVRRAAGLPGVAGVAATSTPPFSGGSSSSSFEVEDQIPAIGAPSPEAQRRFTTPAYFATAGIPVIAGQVYSDVDHTGAPPVVVVSQSLARRIWPGQSAIGKRIKWVNQWRTVIGVVGDVKLRTLLDSDMPTIYAPMAQLLRGGDPSLVIRTSPVARNVAADVRALLRDVAPDVAISGIDEMDDLVAASLSNERFRTQLISFFASIAALLAAAGVYGVAATAATRRSQEMAIRSALGASNASVMRLIVAAGARGVVVGAVLGVLLALVATRVLTPYLYGISAADLGSYVVVLVLLGVTTIVATFVPARRVTRLALVESLKGE